jgi:hypothetical protein
VTERVCWEQVRELIERRTGPVTTAHQVGDGRNSEVAVVIDHKIFVKGLRTDHPRVWTQERERRVNPSVRHISASLLWSEVVDGWDLNGFEYVAGRPAVYAPGSSDLEPITFMMSRFPKAPGDIELKKAEQRWSGYSHQAHIFAGDRLSHTDWSPANVLVHNHTALMVDWAWPTLGAAWLDPACWVVWLIAGGHSPGEAEAWARKVPAFAQAPHSALTTFASAQAAMWEDIGEHAPHPGLAAAAAGWAKYRNS